MSIQIKFYQHINSTSGLFLFYAIFTNDSNYCYQPTQYLSSSGPEGHKAVSLSLQSPLSLAIVLSSLQEFFPMPFLSLYCSAPCCCRPPLFPFPFWCQESAMTKWLPSYILSPMADPWPSLFPLCLFYYKFLLPSISFE